MPCLPGLRPVMQFVHETLEIVGMDERMGAMVPVSASRASVGTTPRAMRSCTSGSPTPSSPSTATRRAAGRPAAGSRAPPRRRRSKRPRLDLLLRHAHDLGDRGHAFADLLPAVLAQRAHPLADGRVADDVGRGVIEDELADRVVHDEQLVDARAAAVARLRAVLAAGALGELDGCARHPAHDLAQRLPRHLDRAPAALADAADQPLGEHAEQRGGEQVVLDAHLEEPRDRARGVVRVQGREDEVPRERRLDGDLGGLGVADLPHHDHVGILAHDRAQPVGEGEADRRLHVDLVHAEELILDRILDGDDLLVRRVDLVEGPVEGGGLAAARGAGHQDHPVGLHDELLELRERVRGEAEGLEVHDDARAIEDAHHDALAVERRQRRDPQIDLPPHHAQLDPPVLRQPPLGDVELRHDLHARDDGRLEPTGRGVDVVQHAVDAVADLELVLERLDVDVRGALLERAVDELVDEPDHRRLAREIAQVVHVLLVVGEVLDVAEALVPGAVAVARAVRVRRLEPLEDVALAREPRLDRKPRGDLQPLDRVVVRGVRHGHDERAIAQRDGTLVVAMADPADYYTIQGLQVATGLSIEPRLARERDILEGLEAAYSNGASDGNGAGDESLGDIEYLSDDEEDVNHLRDLASEAPVIRLVNQLINRALEQRASDIHIEPFENELKVRYRIDGVLHDVDTPARRLLAAIVSRVKIMAKLNIAERRLPQDGRIKLRMMGREIDLRVSTLPTLYGESVVMRILDRSSIVVNLESLGFPADTLAQFEQLIVKPYGMILVTGPTGSGKTTTLYGALDKINSPDKKIITIEDPVEYQLFGVNQIHVKPSIGLTFANGLRSIVRQDPDVIMVGEIRDAETAEIAIQAALTGHLVFSTLHTNDAAGAVSRLLEMGVEDYLLAS